MRYFKLLKDAPELKAGAIVTHSQPGDGYFANKSEIYDTNSSGVFYSAKTVESQLDWFVEVEPVAPKFRVKKHDNQN